MPQDQRQKQKDNKQNDIDENAKKMSTNLISLIDVKKQNTRHNKQGVQTRKLAIENRAKKFVLAGGGTGGHIYPAIGIAQALQRLNSEVDIVFIGGINRLEATLVPQHGFQFFPITVEGFPRRLTVKWFSVIIKVSVGLLQSLKYLKQIKPDVVIGTGGYVSGPVLFAAWLLDIPIAIQEQNVSPGLTNSIVASWAKAAYLALPQATPRFPEDIVQVTGNPIRPGITEFARDENTYRKYNLCPNNKTVFVMGGSQGSQTVNETLINAAPFVAKYTCTHNLESKNDAVASLDSSRTVPIQIIHQTGKVSGDDVRAAYAENGILNHVQPFFDQVEEIYSIADLMICRAGGMTVSEVTACGIPAIFIPLPAAVGNNQVDNAESVAKAGAAIVLQQSILTPELLADQMYHILTDQDTYSKMKSASKKLGHPRASQTIAEAIYKLT